MIKDCPFNTCAKYSEKTCISYPLICTRTYTYEGRSVIEWRAIALAHAHTCQYSFRRAIIACAKLYMSYRTQTLQQQVCSVILSQIIHLQLHVKLTFHTQKSICKQCNPPLTYQFCKSGNMLDFSRFNVIISNLVICSPIFSFTLITGHVMTCDLESYATVIKRCFGVRQPHVRRFL